jgi:hypothetical protein
MRNISGWGLSLLLAASATHSQTPTRPTVVELYTSEGCNSCPPAEAMIGVLTQQRPDVIALAFHVTYWDGIGWRDRFDLPEATERQQQYQHALHLSSVYTPQLVIDGQRDLVGNNDPRTVPASTRPQTVALQIAVRDQQVNVSLGAGAPGSGASAGTNDVLLVSYLHEGVSKITGGENAGRELHEFNIVRSIRKLGTWKGEATSFAVPLKSLPVDATQVAVLVQAPNEGPIVGSAAQSLR